MTETITMPAETWAELKTRIADMESLWDRTDGRKPAEWTPDELMDNAALADDYISALIWLVAEVDDNNTRARYMALAADDQLPLFAGALE